MSLKNTPLLKLDSTKQGFFTVKNPKYVRNLNITSASSPCLTAAQTHRIKKCKFIRNALIFFAEDSTKQHLYRLLCKFHQKTSSIFTTSSQHYHEIIRNPKKYIIHLDNLFCWKTLFQKRSLRLLGISMDNAIGIRQEKHIRWILYRLKHCTRGFISIKGVEIAGNILNKQTEKVLDHLIQTIQQQCPNVFLEAKVWDNENDNLRWLNLPIIKKNATSIYFINKYEHTSSLLKTIQNFPSFNVLQRLEFWMKLFPNSDFLCLEKLKECKLLQELRLRFEFELDIQLVSQKFLTHAKFPESLTCLTLYISGLRLFWINDQPKSEKIETDAFVAPFLEQFEKLSNLKTFQLTLYEFRIEFSSIIPIIMDHLKALKELFLVMVLKDFDFKQASKVPILDFGYLCKELKRVFSQLRLLSIEFPCIFIEEFDTSIDSLQNLQALSLGYRIVSKNKTLPKLNLVLEKLNPDKITELNLSDCNTDQDEEFKKRFDILSKFGLLQTLTIAITIKSISTQLFNHFCGCIQNLSSLRRLSCRFERAHIDDKEWMLKFRRMLGGKTLISLAFVSTKNNSLQFGR